MNSSIHRMARRLAALLLAVCMVAGIMLERPAIVAYADISTELDADNVSNTGNCESTRYYWTTSVRTSPSVSTNGRTFDLKGIGTKGDIQTTYGTPNFGYATFIQQGDQSNTRKHLDFPKNGSVIKPAGMNLEVKLTVSPSDDNKYVLVDYYVCDISGARRTIWLGGGSDIQVDGDDSAYLYQTKRGFHMVNRTSKTAFDCITNDPAIKTTKPTTRWVGNYGGWINNLFVRSNNLETNAFTGGDSGLAYAWEIDLRPYETVHKRIAFAVRDASYYVLHGEVVNNKGQIVRGEDSGGDAYGTYDKPYATIEYALQKIGNKKGYIYLMDDYPVSDELLELINKSSQDITIASTDMDVNGEPQTIETPGYYKTLKRADGYEGSILSVKGSATLKLTDIRLDGNGAEATDPLIAVSGNGELRINTGAVITNCRGNESSLGSAVAVTGGNAGLVINMGSVTGNTTAGKGAVYYDGKADGFQVRNESENLVCGNTAADGKDRNVYLPVGKYITVCNDLGHSKIGVTSSGRPAASPGGVSEAQDQEIVIAKAAADYPGGVDACPFAGNFIADETSRNRSTYTDMGTDSLGNKAHTVLRRNGYAIDLLYLDATTGAAVPGTESWKVRESAGGGDEVTIEAPAALEGYNLDNVKIVQGPAGTMATRPKGDPDFGKVTGVMSAQNVTITYEYSKKQGLITFDARGGEPAPSPIEGSVGGLVTGIKPTVRRYGYIFKGWTTDPDGKTPEELPKNFPKDPVKYYAIYDPNPAITHDYTVEYANADGSVSFKRTSGERKPVEAELKSEAQTIHGYVWDAAASTRSGMRPESYDFGDGKGSQPFGTFDQADSRFTGRMPGQEADVRFIYQVNFAGGDAAKSLFRVKHLTEAGTVVHETEETKVFPEEQITAAPKEEYGFRFVEGRVTLGRVAKTTDGDLRNALRDEHFDPDGTYTAIMPNQDVEVVYYYEPTDEGYEYKVSYRDDEAQAEWLKDITGPDVRNVRAEAEVKAECKNLYGYLYQDKKTDPTDLTAIGSFDADNNFSGHMTNDALSIAYHYKRDADKWGTLTYKAGEHGSLKKGQGTAKDVMQFGDEFKASVLINDGSAEGATGSYTWQDIGDKKLVPEAVGEKYYKLGGWFIDADGDGVLDDGEEVITPNRRFNKTDANELTAYFVKDPDQWIDITFAAGEHGVLDVEGGSCGINVPFDYTWAQVKGKAPDFRPEVNYLTDGWYHGTELMEDETALVKNGVYTIEFYPDPAVFGTEVAEREALAGIDTQGKGRITVFGTTRGYRYILTDLTGKVLAVTDGNISGRVYFEGRYPEERYHIYEAAGKTQVQAGQQISEVTGKLGGPTEVLVPVVETNYRILYDEEQDGKTALVIQPADTASDYALLDKDGNVVMAPEAGAGGWQTPSGAQPASLTFSGLTYNGEYVVVARPHGVSDITAESRREDGTVIVADPGGDIDIPEFIVEAINGTVVSVGGTEVNGVRYDAAHEGDEVKLTAAAQDGAGHPFRYWKVTAGEIPGMEEQIYRQDMSFEMPKTNVVVTAYYKREKASPSNAEVTDEVRGGNPHEMALDPGEVENLEESLTTCLDRIIMDENKKDVMYKVVYKKTAVKATESNAIKASDEYEGHKDACQGAWGLDVSIERYVNGRKVGKASPSDAEFDTIVQLDREDVDMRDYQLFEMQKDPDSGEMLAVAVGMSEDPEETGGLFTFRAKAGARYVLVYSKAYRIYFINNETEEKYRYSFTVRRGEAPCDPDYEDEYGELAEQLDQFVDSEGVEYNYVGWSYREDRMKDFDEEKPIRMKTYIYAFYENNRDEVDDLRKQLEDAINAAIKKSDDYFLTVKESEKIKEAIEEAMDVFDKNPRAPLPELLEALDRLEETCEPFDEILEDRYHHYDQMQNGGNSGGTSSGDGWGSGGSSSGGSGGSGGSGSDSGSGGSGNGSGSGSSGSGGSSSGGSGSGSGGLGSVGGPGAAAGFGSYGPGGLSVGPVTVPTPYVADLARSYTVGTNGKWVQLDEAGERWAFVLNGGIRLTGIWAKLDYANGDVNKNGWYHFNSSGIMDDGWFRDEHMDWYYCNTVRDGWRGKMKTGWHFDEEDRHWYYLDPQTGRMVTGWQQIEGKWYYFTPQTTAATYSYDRGRGKWMFTQNPGRPLGSMYINERTPDGYQVGIDGAFRE